jgi:hypothetical protein
MRDARERGSANIVDDFISLAEAAARLPETFRLLPQTVEF